MVQANASYEERIEKIETLLAMIVSSNEDKALNDGFNLLYRMWSNILKNPMDPKFRKINSTKDVIKKTIFDLKGASVVELVQAAGF